MIRNKSNTIGHIIKVDGPKVTIKLNKEVKSAARATIDGLEMTVLINSLVTFEIGGGEEVIGIITGLSSKETQESLNSDLELELTKPYRIAWIRLLGKISRANSDNENGQNVDFQQGVSQLPSLETDAKIPDREVLKAILEDAPKMNIPSEQQEDKDYDTNLKLGSSSTIQKQVVNASFNDLLSRPFAVLGNTGSGKSWSIAHILQSIKNKFNYSNSECTPKIFLFDINGEYSNALNINKGQREVNNVYINGKKFGLPIWLWNLYELNHLFRTSEQTQKPVFNRLILDAKEHNMLSQKSMEIHRAFEGFDIIKKLVGKIQEIRKPFKDTKYPRKKFVNTYNEIESYIKECINEVDYDGEDLLIELQKIEEIKIEEEGRTNYNGDPEYNLDEENKAKIGEWGDKFLNKIEIEKNKFREHFGFSILSADIPVFFDKDILKDKNAFRKASRVVEGQQDLSQHLIGLHLRIQEKMNDEKWQFAFNSGSISSESESIDFNEWLKEIGLSGDDSIQSPITVFDCSMLDNKILPYFCGVMSRILLDLRQHVAPKKRFNEPWSIILEEAHNYIKPYRDTESRGVKVARQTFERIAKEGRKFGLSMILASQRPRDISDTVLSQCSNFLVHRLQNPDDIAHFKRMVPAQSERLLDQVTALTKGEGLFFGSAVNIPVRLQIDAPDPEPKSKSASPYFAWQDNQVDCNPFPLEEALDNWIPDINEEQDEEENSEQDESENNNNNEEASEVSDDEDPIPF